MLFTSVILEETIPWALREELAKAESIMPMLLLAPRSHQLESRSRADIQSASCHFPSIFRASSAHILSRLPATLGFRTTYPDSKPRLECSIFTRDKGLKIGEEGDGEKS